MTAPSSETPAREKRGDKLCLDSETLMKIAIDRYCAFPEWQGSVATAMRQHQMAQVQLMLDATRKVTDATKIKYVIDLEVQLAAANWKIAIIQQAVKEFAARADTP